MHRKSPAASVYFAPACKIQRIKPSLPFRIRDKRIIELKKQLEEERTRQGAIRDAKIREMEAFKTQHFQLKTRHAEMMELQDKKIHQALKLEIRRDQINAKFDPSIAISKANSIKKYLKCLVYTKGQKYEIIRRVGGVKVYERLKTMVLYTETKKIIKAAMDKIVYLDIKQFESEDGKPNFLMISLKESAYKDYSGGFKTVNSLNPSKYNREKDPEATIQLCIYAVIGKNFSLKKTYNLDHVSSMVSSFCLPQRDTIRTFNCLSDSSEELQIVPKRRPVRSSIYENLAINRNDQLNQLVAIEYRLARISERELNSSCISSGESKKEHKNEVMDSTQMFRLAMENDPSLKQSNREGEKNSIQDISSDNNTHLDSAVMSSNQIFEQEGTFKKSPSRGVVDPKQCSSKRELFAKNIKVRRHFLFRQQDALLPTRNPLENIVLLKKTKQIYWLQDYLALPYKLSKIQIAFKKWTLKIRLQKQLRRTLLYHVFTLQESYESQIGLTASKNIKILYTLKRNQSTQTVYLTCENIEHIPEGVFCIRIPFYEEPPREVQANKNTRGSSRGKHPISHNSRSSKRKSNPKPIVEKRTEQVALEEAKALERNIVIMKKKLEDFFQENLVSLKKKRFLKRINFQSNKRAILYFQAKTRMRIVRQHYLKRSKMTMECHYNFETKTLITVFLDLVQSQTIITVQDTLKERGTSILVIRLPSLHQEFIASFCGQYFSNQCTSLVQQQLKKELFQAIAKHEEDLEKIEREKPTRYQNCVKKFLHSLIFKIRARRNIYLTKKIMVKKVSYALIIRRNQICRDVLHCNIYELSQDRMPNKETKHCFQDSHAVIRPVKKHKFWAFETIYVSQKYFEGISKKKIVFQFFCGDKLFLLKPKKKPDSCFIERMIPLDITCEEITRQITTFASENMEEVCNEKKDLLPYKGFPIDSKLRRESVLPPVKNPKKASIDFGQQILWGLVENSAFLNNELETKLSNDSHNKRSSKITTHGSTGKLEKGAYAIKENTQGSVIYYSIVKEGSFDYFLLLYIVTGDESSKEFKEFHKQRLYLSQFSESCLNLVCSRVAKWMKCHTESIVEINQKKKQADNKIKRDGREESVTPTSPFNILERHHVF